MYFIVLFVVNVHIHSVCSETTARGASLNCSGSASISILVTFNATPSGKFRSIYSKNVDNVEPVIRWKWTKWKYVRLSYWTRCFLWTKADFSTVYRWTLYGSFGRQLKKRPIPTNYDLQLFISSHDHQIQSDGLPFSNFDIQVLRSGCREFYIALHNCWIMSTNFKFEPLEQFIRFLFFDVRRILQLCVSICLHAVESERLHRTSRKIRPHHWQSRYELLKKRRN